MILTWRNFIFAWKTFFFLFLWLFMPTLNVLLNHLAHINDDDESHTKKSTSNPLLFKRHVQKPKEKTELVAVCEFPSSIISACHGNDKEWDFQMPAAEDSQ